MERKYSLELRQILQRQKRSQFVYRWSLLLLSGGSAALLDFANSRYHLVERSQDFTGPAFAILVGGGLSSFVLGRWVAGLMLSQSIELGFASAAGLVGAVAAGHLSLTRQTSSSLEFAPASLLSCVFAIGLLFAWRVVWSALLLIPEFLMGCGVYIGACLSVVSILTFLNNRRDPSTLGTLVLGLGVTFASVLFLGGLKRLGGQIQNEEWLRQACSHGVCFAVQQPERCPECVARQRAKEAEDRASRAAAEAQLQASRAASEARDREERKRRLDEHVRRQERMRTLDGLRTLDPNEFQELAWRVFEANGYIVERTAMSRDGGVDGWAVRGAERFVLQCKRYGASNRVGAPAIRDLFGVMTHHAAAGAYIITTGRLTEDARQFLSGKAIIVIDQDKIVDWVRVLTYPSAPSARES